MKEKKSEKINHKPEPYINLTHNTDVSEDNLFKVHNAIDNGAKGVIVLINYKLLRGKTLIELEKQIIDISKTLHINGCMVKLVIESRLFTFQQFKTTYELCSTANVDFVKFQQI